MLFAILQKYDFSSKSQQATEQQKALGGCLRYCKSTIFQANHNHIPRQVRATGLFAILQKYDFSSKSQHVHVDKSTFSVVCDTAKVRFFKQITTAIAPIAHGVMLFAILQKYDFSSKSQRPLYSFNALGCCLRYCKSTIFQANHNSMICLIGLLIVVCDTAKVRFFKQITTNLLVHILLFLLFAILQKYDFSSKSQLFGRTFCGKFRCLRYCKSTIFQANHNQTLTEKEQTAVVCDTAKVRFFKQITTASTLKIPSERCLRYCKSTIFQANHNECR